MTHFPWQNGSNAMRAYSKECTDKVVALERSQAVIAFALDGTILHANALFASLLGYREAELQGRNYRSLTGSAPAQLVECRRLWDSLTQGRAMSGEFLYLAKSGEEVWVEATFSPLLDESGKTYNVLAIAIDITDQVAREAANKAKADAIERAYGVLEMDIDGSIISANDLYLRMTGATIDKLQGRTHATLNAAQSPQAAAHRQLWDQLRRGEAVSGIYKRRNARGEDLWLEASYNPIFDRAGKVYKIVELAIDITEQYRETLEIKGQVEAINRVQAVIHFNIDGTIQWANDNFLQTMGYSLAEIQGQHHSLFVEAKHRESNEYRRFWEDLRSGADRSGRVCRVARNGSLVWLQAAYSPIFDCDGTPIKVVTFAQNISDTVRQRVDSGHAVDSTFGQIIDAVSTVSRQSQSVSNASESTLETVQAVAAASEELSASISAIGQSMDESKSAVKIVNRETLLAEESTKRLDEKAGAMNKIADLIKEIADQINLLSLNAAIESARAGEAGRGFAVVAGEVKNLANQVQSATVNISKEINEMQGVAREVVKALSVILKSVESVDLAVNGVASAVEEQGNATSEISSHMQRATSEVKNITDNLSAMLYSIEQVDSLASNGKEALVSMMS